MTEDKSHLDDSVRIFVLNLCTFIWARKWWLIASIVIAISIALTIIKMSEPLYRSSATIKLDIMKLASFSDEIIPTSYLADDLIVDTEIQILKSRGLAERVIKLGDAQKILSDPDLDPEAIRQQALQQFARGLRVEREGSTALVTIYFSHQEPNFAAFMADGLVDEYLDFKLDLQTDRIDQRRQFLKNELQLTLTRLQEAEQKSQDFAREKQLPHGTDKTLLELEEEILKRDQIEQSVAIQLREQNHHALQNLISQQQNPSELSGAILVQQINPQISIVQSEYTQASLEIASLIATGNAPPKNSPTMRKIEALGNALVALVTAARDASLIDLELSKNRLAETAKRYDNLRSITELSLSDQNKLQKLKIDETAIQNEFGNLNTELQNIWSQNDFLRTPAEKISGAIPSLTPFSPRISRILASCLAISIMIFGLSLLINRQVFPKVEFESDLLRMNDVTFFRERETDLHISNFIAQNHGVLGMMPYAEAPSFEPTLKKVIQSFQALGKTVSILNLWTTTYDISGIEPMEWREHYHSDQALINADSDVTIVVFKPATSYLDAPKSLEQCDEVFMVLKLRTAPLQACLQKLRQLTAKAHGIKIMLIK